MTPKEKAKELFSKYQNIYLTEESMGIDDELAKQCALIAVDLVINNVPENIKSEIEIFSNPMLDFWQEVKKK